MSQGLILGRLGINKRCMETGVLIRVVIKWSLPSTDISVSLFLGCMLLYLLKTLFIMFKCHFTFFLTRSLIYSFASNWTSACEVQFWLSAEVIAVCEWAVPGLNTESLCELFHYFAVRKVLLLDKDAVDSWLGLFILSLPTPLHPGCSLKKPHMKDPPHQRMGANGGLVRCWSLQLQTTPNTVQRCLLAHASS